MFSHIASKISTLVLHGILMLELRKKGVITGGALGLQGAGQGGQTPHCNNIIDEHRPRYAWAHKGRRTPHAAANGTMSQ